MRNAEREKLLQRMKTAVAIEDREDAHIEADNILIEALEALGEDDLVKLWLDGSSHWWWG
jgi:hypothetical protein